MDITDKDAEGGSTYAQWLRTGIKIKEYIAKKHDEEYADRNTQIYYQSEKYDHSVNVKDGYRVVTTKYGKNNEENAFKNSGELIAVGLHTLYDDRLWMCEQGQITCKKEAAEQINDIKLLQARTTTSTQDEDPSDGMADLPVFPGTGCPWFTISDDNKETYNVENNGIKYWFTKNDYDATITIMVQNYGADPDCYQSMSFGKLAVLDKTHVMYPLYVAGGTQGLSQDTMTYTPRNSDKPTSMGSANVYDLDIDNICLSNSNLLSPTKFNDANMSNFRVLTAEGLWRDIFGFEQKAKLEAMPTCEDDPQDFYVELQEPTLPEEEHHAAYHCMAESLHRMDIYTINQLFNGYDHSSTLERVLVYLNDLCDNGANGYQGFIPNVYASWFREFPIGEVAINNKKFLSVPNGWETRCWFYDGSAEQKSKNDIDNKNLKKKMDDVLKAANNNKMTHRLLIPLEDGA